MDAAVGDPDAAAVIIAVRRAVDPRAGAVVIAGGHAAIDGIGVPAATVIVPAVGVDAVPVAAGQLVADDRAADSADDRARAPVVVSGHGAAQEGARDRADGRTRRAVGAALFTGLLGHCQRRDEGRDGKAGEEKVLTHGGTPGRGYLSRPYLAQRKL